MRLSLGTNFQFKLSILIFWTKYAQNGCFRLNTEKVNNTIEFYIFELVLGPNFGLNWQFCFLDQVCPKRVFFIQKREREVNITQTVFIFVCLFVCLFVLTNYPQKGHFQSKTEKSHLSVRPWLLLTILNFSARRPTDTAVF